MISYVIILKVVASLVVLRFMRILFIVRQGSKKKVSRFQVMYFLVIAALMIAGLWINY